MWVKFADLRFYRRNKFQESLEAGAVSSPPPCQAAILKPFTASNMSCWVGVSSVGCLWRWRIRPKSRIGRAVGLVSSESVASLPSGGRLMIALTRTYYYGFLRLYSEKLKRIVTR